MMSHFETIERTFNREFECNNDAEATSFVKEQSQSWRFVLDDVRRALVAREDYPAAEALTKLMQAIESQDFMTIKFDDKKRMFIVRGLVPVVVLSGSSLNQVCLSRPHSILGYLAQEWTEGVYTLLKNRFAASTQEEREVVQEIIRDLFSVRVMSEAVEYRVWKHGKEIESLIADRMSREILPSVEKIASDYEAAISRTNSEKAELFAEINALSEKMSRKILSAERDIEGINQNAKKEIAEIVEGARKDIDALKQAAIEANAMRTSAQIWAQKHKKHARFFAFTLFLLPTAVFSLLAIYFSFIEVLVGYVREDNVQQFGAITTFIVFLGVPALSAIILLRMISRWAINSMVMSEDAEQRRAMLDTYLTLVATKEAEMKEADRILILNAIFRPLPGHQSEDISPPSLQDLVQGVLRQGGAPRVP